jgi:hypothetical protein
MHHTCRLSGYLEILHWHFCRASPRSSQSLEHGDHIFPVAGDWLRSTRSASDQDHHCPSYPASPYRLSVWFLKLRLLTQGVTNGVYFLFAAGYTKRSTEPWANLGRSGNSKPKQAAGSVSADIQAALRTSRASHSQVTGCELRYWKANEL